MSDGSTAESMSTLLDAAARLWLRDHPVPEHYSTAHNEFLYAAEHAYFDQSDEQLRDEPHFVRALAHALDCDPSVLRAVVDGAISGPRLTGCWPSGGMVFLQTADDLANYTADAARVRAIGFAACQEEDDRHRQERPSAPPPPQKDKPPQKFTVYRLVDSEGRTVYIGSTRNLPGRVRSHQRNWGDLFTEVVPTEYPDAKSMLAAETAAIKAECPPLNSAGVR